jgi:hypothetical protein
MKANMRPNVTRTLPIFIVVMLLLTACRERGLTLDDIPTPYSIDARATEVVLTQNAPPSGFGEVAFSKIDQNLLLLNGWHYTVDIEFDGVFTQVERKATGRIVADVWYDQVSSARRVVVESQGDLLGLDAPSEFEAVKLGPDTFLVQNGACLSNADESADLLASAEAGSLVGGINTSSASGFPQQTKNDQRVWQYNINFDQLNLPQLILNENSRVLAFNGELWVSPDHDAVVRYYLTIDVENAQVFTNVLNTSLPVTGRLIVRYDVFDIGTVPNLSVPRGC